MIPKPLTSLPSPNSRLSPTRGEELVSVESRFDLVFTVLNVGATLGAFILPFFFHSISAVVAFLLMYTICGLGLTMGYHRLFAHRSYWVPKWLEHTIAMCGFLALQRGPIFWVAMHRLHHLHVDVPGKDPHSPLEGIWHVHFGWVHKRRVDVWDQQRYHKLVPELLADPLYRWMDKPSSDYILNSILLIVSFATGGLIGGGFSTFDIHNAICFLVWVGMLNRVALLQAFGLVNSVCHMFGTQPFRTKKTGLSTNNLFVSLIIFGEGWHNNHHAFPTSARQGLLPRQIDISWHVICFLRAIGLARNVKTPSPESIARIRIDERSPATRTSPR